MAIKTYAERKKEEEEKLKKTKIKKYSDYAKENNIDYKINYIGDVNEYISKKNTKSALSTATKSYNTINDVVNSLSSYSDEAINSAIEEATNQKDYFKNKISNIAKENNIETSKNKNLVKSQGEYRSDSLKDTLDNKYSQANKYKRNTISEMAETSDTKYTENKEKFETQIKPTEEYKEYEDYAYKALPALNLSKNYREVMNDKTGIGDKIFAPGFGGLAEGFNNTFLPTSDTYKLANGEIVRTTTKAGLKGQKVMSEAESLPGKIYASATYSLGNMAPSLVAGAINPILGTTVMATGTYKQAYNNSLAEGYTKEQANRYATANATLETALGKALGGMSTIMGKSGLSNVVSKSLSKVMSNKATRDILADMGSEFTEEYLQEIIDPVVRNITLGENNEIKLFSQEALIAGLSGSLTSGITNLPNYVVNKANNNNLNVNDGINQFNKSNLPGINNIVTNSQVESAINKGQQTTNKNETNIQNNNIVKNSIFSKQIDEVLEGTYPKRDMLIVSETTPKILQDIGLKNLPITMTQKHLYTMTNESGKYENVNYHNIDMDVIKQIPEALERPLNVLKSDTKDDSVVVVTELADKNGDIIVASIKVDGKGTVQDIRVDSNVMTSAYGKSGNYDYFMKNNIAKGNLLYDIDEGIINTINNNTQKKSDVKDRFQLPMRDSSSSTTTSDIPKNTSPISYDNNITQSDKNVKLPSINNMKESTNNMPLLPNFDSKTLDPLEISKLTQENANTTPKLPNINRNKVNDRNSKFYENVRDKVDMLNEQQKHTIMDEEEVQYYDKVTNKESLEKAFERLEKNGSFATEKWFNKDAKNCDAVDVAEGWILLKQYADSGNADGMVEVAKKLRNIGTQAGQTIQAFNIMERMTPEGMVKYAQSELQEAYEEMVKNKSKEWIDKYKLDFDLKPEEVAFIMENMNDISNMEDGYDKRVKLAEIQKIMTDKLPPERGAGIKSWMRISMLFNPKTQVRNVMGNAVITPVNYFSDLFSSVIDKQVSKRTGYRTIGKTNLKNYVKGFKKGFFESYNDFKKGINTRNIQGNRFEINQGKSFNDNTTIGKNLNRVDSLLSFMLDAGDRTFYEAAFTNSINNQMVLNNTTEVTQNMIDIATQEALSRTWQDNNNYTKGVLWVRNWLNNVNIKGYGLGDVLIPFAKTPANLTKAIIDYSPAGLVNTITSGINLKRSLNNGQYTPQMQHQFVQNLGKATAGTMLYVLGYALAKSGVISGESDEDKDTKDFMKNTLGINSYSIKIGNKSFTYDWAQPIAAPLSIMANYVKKSEENTNASKLENLITSLDVAGNILLEQSFMESINTVLSNNNGIATGFQEAILELPSRAIPTLMKQIVDLTDSTQRTSFEYDKPLETMVNKVKAKVPGLSKTLAPVVDTMGREVQRYGGKNNIFNVFLNPANVSTENISESAKEIYNVYKSTGDATVMPRVAPYYINKDGEKIILNSTQKAEYQKISGNIIEESVLELLKESKYKNLSADEKASIINKIVNYSYNKAREEVLSLEMSNEYNKINEYTSNGGKVSDYYLNKEEIDYSLANPEKYAVIYQITTYDKYNKYKEELKNIRDNSDNKKTDTINYINSLKLSIPQKAMFIRQYYTSFDNYNEQIVEYINKQKLTKDEKIEILKELGFEIKNGRVYW